ncbi:hypothetical protein J6590_002523 [Homalodisca vitripennis]|nr:hypothetical protein J6590_002523 [Homalodisca vitripennis]
MQVWTLQLIKNYENLNRINATVEGHKCPKSNIMFTQLFIMSEPPFTARSPRRAAGEAGQHSAAGGAGAGATLQGLPPYVRQDYVSITITTAPRALTLVTLIYIGYRWDTDTRACATCRRSVALPDTALFAHNRIHLTGMWFIETGFRQQQPAP